MYNNQKRVELVKRRIYERNCQQQRHGIYGLSAAYTDGGSGNVRFCPAV